MVPGEGPKELGGVNRQHAREESLHASGEAAGNGLDATADQIQHWELSGQSGSLVHLAPLDDSGSALLGVTGSLLSQILANSEAKTILAASESPTATVR